MLREIGWKTFFQQQCLAHADHLTPARVTEVQRSGLRVEPALPGFTEFPLGGRWFQNTPEDRPTVGDWLLIDPENGAIEVLLERHSLIKRLAPDGELQLIAANIDIGFIVTSANADFSLPRIERYLAVLLEANIQPVVIITKADLAEDGDSYVQAVHGLDNAVPGLGVPVELVNALDESDMRGVAGWCQPGQSIALLGSSGVGKSTLVNTLSGQPVQLTRASREADAKGRHTTTTRTLHRLPNGAVILDSPGMREFQLADVEQGVRGVFDDIDALAEQCRFNDCHHQSEPGCAVLDAVDAGDLDPRRLKSYFKLQREARLNTETVAERHARARQWSKQVKSKAKDKF